MPFYLKGVFSRQFRTLYQVGGGGRPPKSAVGLFVRVTRQSAKWSVFLIPSCNSKIWSFSATRTVLCLRWWWDVFFENCRVAGALQTTVGVKFRDFVAKVQLIEFLAIFVCDFSAVASPVRGRLHMRSGRRQNFKKIASPSKANNRSCSRGLREPTGARLFFYPCFKNKLKG